MKTVVYCNLTSFGSGRLFLLNEAPVKLNCNLKVLRQGLKFKKWLNPIIHPQMQTEGSRVFVEYCIMRKLMIVIDLKQE